ncbi:MAG: glutamine--fructose-6-phosphate transaminase (isomerizing) [Blautia massiliensis (ex Durand et al. 2017)]|uniref:glutamine--fructose-6-phosphate transaminase (isomerizing) n=1 Tax=Blautia TaxID=572511 RepID=UPI00399D438E
MCGIVGFTGRHQAAPILLDGLSKLEYRGYDSAGIAVRDGEKDIEIIKAKGRLKVLLEKTNAGESVPGMCGIGHTRWATHGEPSEVNAHPHVSDNGNVAAVHNGIIENYQELKEKLLRRGYSFYSSTDTEVAVKLVDYYYQKYGGSPVEAVRHAMVRIRGSYALAMMFRDYPEEIFVARKDSPMILGVENGESYIASDVPAILKYTRNVYYIGNLELACVKPGEITFYNLDGEEIEKEPKIIEWDAEAAEKAGFEHFMMKEIHEQPKAVADTLNSVIREGKLDLTEIGLDDERIRSISQVYIVACGSAYHVGMAAQYVIEDLASLPVRVELASEFRYRKPLLDPDGLAVIISQSGETADSLAALRECKEKGIRTLAIVNVVGSSIAREADHVFYTLAGPEISVATTKAYSTQLIASYVLALQMALVRGKISEEQCESYIKELKTLPDKIGRIIEDKERLQWFASKQANAKDIFFIGRGIDYAISLEGSLKMKEISYIHSEAYAAGELKHGTISLIEDGTLVIGVLTQPELYEKTVSNMVECRSRGAYLMGLTTFGNYSIEDTADFTVYIPKTDPHFATSLAVIPLQLLGYYVSVNKGLDVDKPRNLAKSVTVE